MKTVFVVNPKAGQGKGLEKLYAAIEDARTRYELDVDVYTTTAAGDATRFVAEYCQNNPPARFIACGGDGTANEVLHGIIGAPNASMTCYPCGSGNDFVKYYGGAERFLDVDALLAAKEQAIDVMRVDDRYALNVTNFGFDTVVAKTMIAVKHKKIIGGKRAYTTGIIKALFTGMKTKCVVTVDGEQLNEDKILLCTVANGKYVGGAFCCAPHSDNTDGLLEVCLVRPLSRFTFIRLVGPYKRGEHLEDPRFQKHIQYRRGRSVHIKATQGFAFSLDGEIVEKSDFTIEICPAAIRFAVPAVKAEGEAQDTEKEKEPATV